MVLIETFSSGREKNLQGKLLAWMKNGSDIFVENIFLVKGIKQLFLECFCLMKSNDVRKAEAESYFLSPVQAKREKADAYLA